MATVTQEVAVSPVMPEGPGLHPKLAAAFDSLPKPKSPATRLRVAMLRGLLAGYHHRWKSDVWRVHSIEQEFHLPIVNPGTGRASSRSTHAGKFDGVIERDGETYLLEHKTCSEDVTFGSPYWRRMAIDTQVSGYLLAKWVSGERVAGVVYDVIRKPAIRPRKLSSAERVELDKTRRYFGAAVDGDVIEAVLSDPDAREDPYLYERRLTADTLRRPEWYFARQVVTRLHHELAAYADELWQTAREIRRAAREGDHRRNDKACTAFGRACEFLDLCAGHDAPEGVAWTRLKSFHPELEEIDDGRHVLTHSRIATFNTCRRKHHYRYELGITGRDEVEALVFGSLLHEALAAWWTTPAEPGDEPGSATGRRDGPRTLPA